MKSVLRLALLTLSLVPLFAVSSAFADGCYLCGGGSSEKCKDYCRYSGPDTFAARKVCESHGCKVSGTASCPTAVNYKVCMAPAADSPTTVATLLQCVAPRS
jgi:hypothetical protein